MEIPLSQIELERRERVIAVAPVVIDNAGDISFGGLRFRREQNQFANQLHFLTVQPESLAPIQAIAPIDEMKEELSVIDETIGYASLMTSSMIEEIVDQKRQEKQVDKVWYTVFWETVQHETVLRPRIRIYEVPAATVEIGMPQVKQPFQRRGQGIRIH